MTTGLLNLGVSLFFKRSEAKPEPAPGSASQLKTQRGLTGGLGGPNNRTRALPNSSRLEFTLLRGHARRGPAPPTPVPGPPPLPKCLLSWLGSLTGLQPLRVLTCSTIGLIMMCIVRGLSSRLRRPVPRELGSLFCSHRDLRWSEQCWTLSQTQKSLWWWVNNQYLLCPKHYAKCLLGISSFKLIVGIREWRHTVPDGKRYSQDPNLSRLAPGRGPDVTGWFCCSFTVHEKYHTVIQGEGYFLYTIFSLPFLQERVWFHVTP